MLVTIFGFFLQGKLFQAISNALHPLKLNTINNSISMVSTSDAPTPHAVLFPFMSKGHTIPFLQLARLLLNRHISVTVITTPGNRPFISSSLSNTTTTIIEIPFPDDIPGIPAGVENTEKLPSMSLFPIFANATELMQHRFDKVLEIILPVSFLVSDGFLHWTLSSASNFGIPRLFTIGTNTYSMVLAKEYAEYEFTSTIESNDDDSFSFPRFPRIKLTKNDFDFTITDSDPKSAGMVFHTNIVTSMMNSYGMIVNSFYEMESDFVDYWNCDATGTLKAFCIGPLCIAETGKIELDARTKPTWLQWLEKNRIEGKTVLYVAFGTQAAMSNEQFNELAAGLEQSNINFLWALGSKSYEFEDGYEERMKERGFFVREWVDQKAILQHESVKGFLSHCGWNSCLESICARVPILAFPLGADQFLNTRMLVEEVQIGLRIQTCDGSVRGFVKSDEVGKMVKELMQGEMGKKVRQKVMEVGEAAKTAMEEGGSSYKTLEQLIDEMCKFR